MPFSSLLLDIMALPTAPKRSSFLVTGRLGFVGRHVVEELLESGHRVVVVTRPPPPSSSSVDAVTPTISEQPGFSKPVGRIPCDLSDPADVEHEAGVRGEPPSGAPRA